MPSAARALLSSAVATVVVVGAGSALTAPAGQAPVAGPQGVASSPPAAPGALPPTPAGTPLDQVETRGLAVVRAPFCGGVAEDAIVAALGTRARNGVDYRNGERARLTSDLTDVAHEHGCRWSAGGTTARGWVFAPPVHPARARALARSAAAGRGCRPLPGAATFGSPGIALLCRDGGVREASYRGLFADAWLTCSLGVPTPVAWSDLAGRASAWCTAVVAAATGATTLD